MTKLMKAKRDRAGRPPGSGPSRQKKNNPTVSFTPLRAWALMNGHLDHFPLRSGAFKAGDRLHIHANSYRYTSADVESLKEECGITPPSEVPFHCVLASAVVTEVKPVSDNPGDSDVYIAVSDVFDTPVETRGRRGVWEWSRPASPFLPRT